MLIDVPWVRGQLRQIVQRLAWNAALHGDLIQEALIHLWRLEEQRPGQSQHWYLRGCRFHLQNHLRRGRSLDSIKHSRAQIPNGEDSDDTPGPLNGLGADQSGWEEISVRDFIAVVSKWLKPAEQATLLCFAEGLSAREIAKRLQVSHTLVNRHRSKIATLALSLEFGPRSPNGKGHAPNHHASFSGTGERRVTVRI